MIFDSFDKKRLIKKETFHVLYLDLDNFKAYNDVYGFLKGDEIIKAGRIISRIKQLTEYQELISKNLRKY